MRLLLGAPGEVVLATAARSHRILVDLEHAEPASESGALHFGRSAATTWVTRGSSERGLEQYERFGDANARWDVLEERSRQLAEGLGHARRYHQAWLEEQFAPWLDVPRGERRRRVALPYVATDVKTWKLLRRHLGHGRRVTAELMLSLVGAALRPPGIEADR